MQRESRAAVSLLPYSLYAAGDMVGQMLASMQPQHWCCLSHRSSMMAAPVSCLQAAQIEQVLEAVSQMLVRLEALRIAVTVAGGQYRQFFVWLLRNIRLAEGSAALLTAAPCCCIRSHQSPCRPDHQLVQRAQCCSFLSSHLQSCHYAQKPDF